MNKDYTHICFILDRSGSMYSQAADAIGGFNTFIQSQKALPGKATMSLILFDNLFEQPYDFTPINMVPELTHETFIPRGGTALLDAVGRAITQTGIKLAAMPESERPGRVLVAVLTDGEENQSHEFSATRIKEMIDHQQTKYAWQITFLSSDIKAAEQALSYGFATGNTRSAGSIKSAMLGYTLNAERSRSISHESYLATNACAFDEAGVDDVLDSNPAPVATVAGASTSTVNVVNPSPKIVTRSYKTP